MANIFNVLGQKIIGLFSNSSWNSYSRMLGQKGAVWMNVDKPGEVYRTIPQIQGVVDRKAKLFSNMDIRIMQGDEDVTEKHKDITDLLQNPNLFQGMNDWLEDYKRQEQVYGNQFMYKNIPSRLTSMPKTLTNISPAYIKPVHTGKYFDQVDMSGVVSKYEYQDDAGNTRIFETNTILHSMIGDLDNPLMGLSPIMSLRFPITNTKLAYEYFNVISGEKGAIGVMSNRSKDAMGSVPLTPEEKTAIHDSMVNKYGVQDGKKRVLLTNATIDWTPMTYPTKDLLLQEQIDANFMTIVDHFGLNINMFSSKNATFENVRSAIIQTYQDAIQPEADRFMQRLTKFLSLQNGLRLKASYEHLSILQSDKGKEADTLDKQIKSIIQLVDANIIERQQASDIIANITSLELGNIPVITGGGATA